MSSQQEQEIEAVCKAWYGPKWDSQDPKERPGEKMKDVWRGMAKKAIEAIDQIRQPKSNLCPHGYPSTV